MSVTVWTEIYIARPPEAVAEVALDPERAVLWTADLERFEVVSRSPGEVGSVARLHYRERGRPYVMEDVLIEAELPHRFVSRVSGEVLSADIETVLLPVDGGTLVSIRWTGRGRRLPVRWLLPFVRRSIARRAENDLRALKGLVERGGSEPPGGKGQDVR